MAVTAAVVADVIEIALLTAYRQTGLPLELRIWLWITNYDKKEKYDSCIGSAAITIRCKTPGKSVEMRLICVYAFI